MLSSDQEKLQTAGLGGVFLYVDEKVVTIESILMNCIVEFHTQEVVRIENDNEDISEDNSVPCHVTVITEKNNIKKYNFADYFKLSKMMV